jgi:hypothetical protein
MASTGKRKTTMAKLARESRLRERRLEKQARKDARKQATSNPAGQPNDPSALPDDRVPALEARIAQLEGGGEH